MLIGWLEYDLAHQHWLPCHRLDGGLVQIRHQSKNRMLGLGLLQAAWLLSTAKQDSLRVAESLVRRSHRIP